MAIQHNGQLKNHYQAKTVVFLKELQDRLNLSDEEIAQKMCTTSKRYKSFLSYSCVPTMNELQGLLDHYNLSLDALKHDKIDLDVVASHSTGSLLRISERYLKGAFSKRRTINHTLDYIKDNIGYFAYDMTERYFQLNKCILANPEAMINIHFIEDLYTYLAYEQCLPSQEFFKIGMHNLSTLEGSSFARSLTDVTHPKFLYRNLIERDVRLLEKNSDYQLISLTDGSCIFRSNIRQQVSELLSITKVGTTHTCKYREGIFSMLPQFIDLPHAQVQETSCAHRGDEFCQFEVDFSEATYFHELERSKILPFSERLYQQPLH